MHGTGQTAGHHKRDTRHTILMTLPRLLYGLTLTGYFGTLILLTAWFAWLYPPTKAPVSLTLLLIVGPLLLPLRGLLHARRYTISWSCFLALLYFTQHQKLQICCL